jgi:predicted ATPase
MLFFSSFGEFMLFMYSSMNKWQFKPGRSDDEHPVREIAEEVSKDAWLICFDEFMITDVATCAILNQFFTAMFEKGVVM